MTAPVTVIFNPGAGPAGSAPAPEALREVLRAHGIAAEVVVPEAGEDYGALAESALRGHPDLLVAAGGDGTVSAIAARTAGTGTTLGILPLGTRNHFARDLGLPLELDAAVRTLARGRRVAVDVGEVNARTFLNNASLGLYPRIVREREQLPQHSGPARWWALVRAGWHALRVPRASTVALDVDGARLQRRTPALLVGNNHYTMQGFGLAQRERLDGGALSLYVLRPQTPWSLFRLGLRALLGRDPPPDSFEAFGAAALEVDAPRRRLEVAVDGEVLQCEAPLRFRLRPRALRVVVPATGVA